VFALEGRLYGGFWENMPREERWRLRIVGEPICVVDFGQMHLRLLYAEAGVTPPSGDLYAMPRLEEHRDGVKVLINALLNRQGPLTRYPKGCGVLFPKGMSAAAARECVRQVHAPVAHLFEKGAGLRLFRIESDILVAVLLTCKAAGLPALPMHDAIFVPANRATEATAIMCEVFRGVVGAEPEVTCKLACQGVLVNVIDEK
jgi:hypothetical protein